MDPALLLYSRRGCCLCQGLEEKLKALEPPLALQVVDVDSDPDLQAQYGLEVPVLAVPRQGGAPAALPRVSPRLSGAALSRWLAEQLKSLG
ncbi:MAG: glutaredoxin family protein [Cyanobacteria bacterium K_DeepCast_35m_m2_155]|nr:glutaredoxin family protein [Cyanobacteria bacterium K_DeepCast_35m_m2_155]